MATPKVYFLFKDNAEQPDYIGLFVNTKNAAAYTGIASYNLISNAKGRRRSLPGDFIAVELDINPMVPVDHQTMIAKSMEVAKQRSRFNAANNITSEDLKALPAADLEKILKIIAKSKAV